MNPQGPKNPRAEAVSALIRVLSGRSRSTDEVHRVRGILESREAALFQVLLLGVLRRRRALESVLQPLLRRPLDATPPPLRETLMVLAFQGLFLDRVPSHARLSSAVELARHLGGEAAARFVNAVGRSLERSLAGPDPLAGMPPEVLASVPDWIGTRIRQADRGPWTDDLWEVLGQPAPSTLRLYPSPKGTAEVLEEIRSLGIAAEPTPFASRGLRVLEGTPLSDPRLVPGRMIPQDEASQLVVEALAPADGERILDLCAGHGLKTIQILQQAPGARVVAVDLHERKLAEARRLATRLGLPRFRTLAMDARDLPGVLPPASFDRVILDAPCTGLGTLVRRPEVRWTRREEDVAAAAALQRELLAVAARMVRPGGRVLYAVCSFVPEEGPDHRDNAQACGLAPESIERDFPFRHPDGTLRPLPWRDGMDGFYIGAFRAGGDAPKPGTPPS
ncbi:methyltransferase domain-containing protein [Myxococcota bacterium]|nr:methyltransferase domain-containing protein [Myxococcota bacterium]